MSNVTLAEVKSQSPPSRVSRFWRRLVLNRRNGRAIFALLLLLGLIFRAAPVWRPIDETTSSSWRESDMGMIARNFWRGKMNLFNPQIDWRGDTPGYVESEWPLPSWLMALADRALGYHEAFGRLFALAVSLASILVFALLARRLLPPFQARAALVFFMFNPLLINLATNIQPDPYMILGILLGLLTFRRWLEGGRFADLACCALCGALAMLFKLPALMMGLVLAVWSWQKFGWGVFKEVRLYLLAAAMLIPPLLWYGHARHFWLTYGLSLGLSNESHWLGWDLLAQPRLLAALVMNMAWIELKNNFGLWGAALVFFGIAGADFNRRKIILPWFLACLVFYLAALRTTGRNWAFYYHALSAAPACLLMGLACSPRAILRPPRFGPGTISWRRIRSWLIRACFLLTLGVLMLLARKNTDLFPPYHRDPILAERRQAARAFAPLIGSSEKITMIGGPDVDDSGAPVAYDDSTMLFWLDRQGFILSTREDTLTAILETKKKGAKYFIGTRQDPITTDLLRIFKRIGSSGRYDLYRMRNDG